MRQYTSPNENFEYSYLLIEVNFFVHYLSFETTNLLFGQVHYGHLIVPGQVSNLDISTPKV